MGARKTCSSLNKSHDSSEFACTSRGATATTIFGEVFALVGFIELLLPDTVKYSMRLQAGPRLTICNDNNLTNIVIWHGPCIAKPIQPQIISEVIYVYEEDRAFRGRCTTCSECFSDAWTTSHLSQFDATPIRTTLENVQ